MRMKRSRQGNTPPPSDFTKRPKRSPSFHWSDGLINAMTDPEQVFEEDHLMVILKDGFPKAEYHYLIVPRARINSVKDLRKENLPLLQHMHKAAEDLISRVHVKKPKLQFRFGYHALPSMNRIHMHVISQDFNSPRMKTKHHWNTFNTDYFIDSSMVIDMLKKSGRIAVNQYHSDQLTLPMRCNQCPETFDDIGELKTHLTQHCSNPDHHAHTPDPKKKTVGSG